MTWRPGTDRGWREQAAPKIVEICDKATWPSSFHGLLIEASEFAVSRIEGVLTKSGSIAWKDCKMDCVIYFDRVPLHNISVTNPQRMERARDGYPQLKADLADGRYDALPVVLMRLGGQFAVWDGHHRLVTYQSAGRIDVPAIVAWFIPGSGQVKVIRKAES